MGQSEYAGAGVDPSKIDPFKQIMVEMGKRTLSFPNRREVYVESHAHGAMYWYVGAKSHRWVNTLEGLGNKNWVAEWMYQFSDSGKPYYDGIAIDTALMAVNDALAHGALPVVYEDEVAAGDSEWFEDEVRARDLAEGYYRVCKMVGMALPAGESPSLKYLIKAELPVRSAASLSGCVTSIVSPATRFISGEHLGLGDRILGVTSSGIHANGISLVIKRTLSLPDQFLTKLPNGNTLGEESLVPTRSYVALVEALLDDMVNIHCLLPGTGGGVRKIAALRRPFTYRIHNWVEVPLLFQFMRELGVSIRDCLGTFNWGVGYYIFVPSSEIDRVIAIGRNVGYEVADIGVVEDGERKVIFGPENDLVLPPPEE